MDRQYAQFIQNILLTGIQAAPRGMPVLEVYNGLFTLENPHDCIAKIKPMHTRLEYAEAELKWYESGSNKIADMGKFSDVWKQYSDDGVHVNSAYGQFIFTEGSIPGKLESQWEWVKRKLIYDPDTRQAIININQPIHKFHVNEEGTRDFPCCVCMFFSIREGKLCLHTQFRSQDINTGLRNDVYTMAKLHIRMAKELSLEVGTFSNGAFNLHLYEKDIEMAIKYVKKVLG